MSIGASSTPTRERLRAGLALAALAALSSLDAIPAIVPLGDDAWIVERPFGGFATEHLERFGQVARILNVWTIDLVAQTDVGEGGLAAATILVLRAITVFVVYIVFRRGFGFGQGTSLLGSAVFAFTPPAFEGWSLITTQGLALSAPLALLAIGLYWRALTDDHDSGRLILWATAAFLAALLFYELWIVSVPAFVCWAALVTWHRRQASLRRVLIASAAAGLAALTWLIALKVSGYLDASIALRGGTEGRTSELADLSQGAALFRVGFIDHHVWRIVEVVRSGSLALWDTTVLGVLAGAATVAAAVLVGWNVSRDPAHRARPGSLPLALGAVGAAYLALLIPGLGNAGFPNTSRFYYAPGLFIALAVALAADSILAHPSRRVERLIAVAIGAYVLWSGALTRYYLAAAVTGARILRETAVAVAAIPPEKRQGGVLVIAPGAVGTFATSAVEPWTIRPAVRRFGHVEPEGPIFLGACDQSAVLNELIPMDYRSRWQGPVHWAAVVRHTGQQAVISEGKAHACEARAR